jgi:single-strand DNA-binding protein
MNSVHLAGRLGQDPTITNFEDGGKSAQFSVATTERGYTRQDGTEVPERTEWIRVETGNRGVAGVIEQYLKKGSFVIIEGKLKNREYEKDGVKRYVTTVTIEKMEFGPKSNNDSANVPAPEPERPKQTSSKPTATSQAAKPAYDSNPDDLPF